MIRTDRIDAVIFDMDGVVTDTARVHAAAWARLSDRFLGDRAAITGKAFRPFTVDDYRRFVDGEPRYAGVRSFLATRGSTLPKGGSSRSCSAASAIRSTTSGTSHATWEYYLARTSGGSTLSGVVDSWVLARLDRARSWDRLTVSIESDVADIQAGTTREGIHLGAMAGTVDVVQRAYMGPGRERRLPVV